jgi:hypothetical protein
MAGGFAVNTRRKVLPLSGAITRPTGGGTFGPLTLPKTGLLARVYLALRGSVAGGISVPNVVGFSSIVSRLRIQANSGIDIFNVSGAGYQYLLRNSLESEYIDPVGQSSGTSAVTATTFNLDAVIPIALNMRDPTGLIMLQNEQTIVNLFIDWLADASVATGATVTLATGDAFLEVFTVPPDPKDWPPLNVIHQCLEDQQSIAAAGDFPYYWPRGNTYVGVYHGTVTTGTTGGMGANTPSDLWNRFAVRVNQSDYLQNTPVDFVDMEYRLQKGRARNLGTIFVDLLATSGLGCYGLARDMFNSALVTDLASVITTTGACTLYTVRRQLVVLT